jgi:RNA polymerase sigma-70 factor (ECF subfamily)
MLTAQQISECRLAALRVANAILRDSNEAEDAAQETMLRAWRHREKFRGECQPKSWICAIARNYALEYMRSSSFLHRPEQIGQRDFWSAEQCAEQSVMEAQRAAAVRQALAALPGKYSDVMRLRYWEEMGAPGISTKLRMGECAVKTRIHRGRAMMRAALKGSIS